MAITYPRALPSTRVTGITFEHEPQEAFAPEQGGRFVSVTLGPALWRMALATTPPNEVEFSLWRAWLDSLDGAGKTFFGYDVRRPMPWNYRNGYAGLVRAGGGSFDGTTFNSLSFNSARDELTIGAAGGANSLPAGFTLIAGDYISLEWAGASSPPNGFTLHRALETAAANGSGVGTWPVRPSVPAGVPGSNVTTQFGNVATAARAACIMRVTTRDRAAEHKNRRISFEAVQHLEFP